MKALKLKFDGKGEVSLDMAGCWMNKLEFEVSVMSGDKVTAQSIHHLLNKHARFAPFENLASREEHYYQANEVLKAALTKVNKESLADVLAVVEACPYFTVEVTN